ncbi:K+/H+ antiporter [Azorhizobium oxalatiphilum]|uniref:K+/H+ antiporter n=1 Tax=Azorhizobium oxalatiphilum TaxID=980631 RepID=A0A917C6B1_9HYPH|nr:potassium/proton antiporter [Azorhizobium oxalatiphilum]GGF74035.1 K+/H+ antiporter [Azorhizobium oxalatiphilum]
MGTVFLSDLVLLIGSALVVLGTVSSILAARFGAPILLVFLLLGILAGESGPGQIHFSDYWATYMVGSAALAVILFDGGLRMRASTMRGALAPAILLSTVGVTITAGLVALAALPLLGLSPLQSLLVGSIVASTDAAAVLFLVRAQGLRLGRRLGAVIEIESATNDPMAVFLTVALVEILASGAADPGWMLAVGLVQQLALGAAIGVAGGFGLALLLNRLDLPGGLHPALVVAVAVFIYAAAAMVHGSGFLAVYLAGLVLGNRPVRSIATITSFHDTVTWLCQIVMFVMLGLLLSPERMVQYVPPALGIAAFLLLVGRPVAVFLCLWPFGFSLREKVFVSWAGLRGAVSIFLATIPMLAQLPGAEAFFNVAFVVVLVSLILHGWSLVFTARRLKVALAEPMRETRRFEIDLPGQSDHELVGYPVTGGTLAVSSGLLPLWARLVMVVRKGQVLTPEAAGVLRAGDYAYLLAPPQRVHQLDPLFMPEERRKSDAPSGFPFAGEVRIGDVADLYGLIVPEAERGVTIADAFADRSDDRPLPGMRFPVGSAAIEVLAVDEGRVTQAALRFETLGEEGLPWLERAMAWLRKRLGGTIPGAG